MSRIKVDDIQGTSGTTSAFTLSGANCTLGGTLSTQPGGTIEVDALSSTTPGNQITVIGEGGSNGTGLSAGMLKAWANFNQTSVFDSLNTASITDNGTGDYGLNFTTNMGNANYCAGGCGVHDGGSYTAIGPQYDHDDPFTTTQCTINYQNVGQSQLDAEPSTLMINGDLA